jgi:hypothetical protein
MMGGLPTQVFLARLIKLLIWSDCLEGFDEIAGKGLARRDDVCPLIADLIRAHAAA